MTASPGREVELSILGELLGDPDPATAKRVVGEMLEMKRIDVAARPGANAAKNCAPAAPRRPGVGGRGATGAVGLPAFRGSQRSMNRTRAGCLPSTARSAAASNAARICSEVASAGTSMVEAMSRSSSPAAQVTRMCIGV